MRKQLEKRFEPYKLDSSHQFGMLLLLSKVESMTQKQLSNATLGDEANTTRLLDKLIKKELIEKHKNPLDKRQQLVTL
ncbi:MAG: MarR family transcriptional regulator, partial [Campylobacterota bacterium]|nr:MarR family transcriptional regulator [Campylobacterota bacterium]